MFGYHAHVRLRLKLAAVLGETKDGGIPRPLSMVFVVALHVPWCRYLAGQEWVTPQLYADNLQTCFWYAHVRLKFKLAAGAWGSLDSGQGYPTWMPP